MWAVLGVLVAVGALAVDVYRDQGELATKSELAELAKELAEVKGRLAVAEGAVTQLNSMNDRIVELQGYHR